MPIEDVDSTIEVGTVRISRQGFGLMMHLSAHSAFTERYRIYKSADEVANDFAKTSNAYRAAKKAFQQDPAPDRIAIGRQDDAGATAQVDTATVDDASLSDGDVFEIEFELRKHEITYNQGGNSPDADEAAQQIVDYINNQTEWYVTASTTGTLGQYELTSDWPGVAFSYGVGSNHSSNTTATSNVGPTETIPEALDAISDVFTDWFGLTVWSRSDSDIADAASWVEGKRKKYMAKSNAPDIVSSATNDVFSDLKGLAYSDSGGFYHTRFWYFPDVALLANRLAVDVDSQLGSFTKVELVGVPTENGADITSTEETYLNDKNAIYYQTEGGLGETQNGKVFNGEWYDVEVGKDWFNSRLEEKVASLLHRKTNSVQDGKVPYTDEGLTEIEGKLREQFQDAYDNDFIDEARKTDAEVNTPKVENISSSKKSNREVPPIEWTHFLAGAVHKVEFTGKLVV